MKATILTTLILACACAFAQPHPGDTLYVNDLQVSKITFENIDTFETRVDAATFTEPDTVSAYIVYFYRPVSVNQSVTLLALMGHVVKTTSGTKYLRWNYAPFDEMYVVIYWKQIK